MIATVRSQTEDVIPVDCSETSDGWRIPGLLASILTVGISSEIPLETENATRD